MHGTLHKLATTTGSFAKKLWQHKAEYFKGSFQENDFSSWNRSYRIQCAKAGYARKWSLSSRTILKSNPSWRFKYFYGKSESLDCHSYSNDLFYLIIFLVTASGKVCTLCFTFQCPENSCSLRSKEKLFQEGVLCPLLSSCLSHIPWAVFDTKPWKLVRFLCHKRGSLRLTYNLPWRMLWNVCGFQTWKCNIGFLTLSV